jgi:hypothetical protein
LRRVLSIATQVSKCRVLLRIDNLSSIPSISFEICTKMRHVVALFRAYGSKGAGPRGSWTKKYGGSESSEQRLQGKDCRQS